MNLITQIVRKLKTNERNIGVIKQIQPQKVSHKVTFALFRDG